MTVISSFVLIFTVVGTTVAQFGNFLGGMQCCFPYNNFMLNPMSMYGNGMDYSTMGGYGLYGGYPYGMMGSYGLNGMNSMSGNYGFGGYGMYGMGLGFGQGMDTMTNGIINSGNNMRKRISSTSKYSSNQQGCSSFSNPGGCSDGGSTGWLEKRT